MVQLHLIPLPDPDRPPPTPLRDYLRQHYPHLREGAWDYTPPSWPIPYAHGTLADPPPPRPRRKAPK